MEDRKELSDAEVVERVLAGDRIAFRILYLRYQAVLARRLRRVLVLSEDVEDVLQTTFAEAYRGLHRFDRQCSLEAWLHGIAFRWAANFLRKQRRRSWLLLAEPPSLASQPDDALSPEENAMRRQLLVRLFGAMQQLGADKRIAFALHEIEELGVTEIGELTGASPQTVWARVQSAKKEILRRLRRTRKSR